MRDEDEREQALDYHLGERPGKIEVIPSKPCQTQRDLSLAYTPGVAVPCLEIQKNPREAFKYTARRNLVAVVSNGTAVLGLGDIGALAGKPVMEGKAVLFKRFADVDVFDLEIKSHDPDDVIKVCQLLEPTFGGINLEDIKAPECFYIEETLKKDVENLGDSVCQAYGVKHLEFDADYLIPKPFDPRVLLREAVTVAKAAIDSGVAQEPIDLRVYGEQVNLRLRKCMSAHA